MEVEIRMQATEPRNTRWNGLTPCIIGYWIWQPCHNVENFEWKSTHNKHPLEFIKRMRFSSKSSSIICELSFLTFLNFSFQHMFSSTKGVLQRGRGRSENISCNKIKVNQNFELRISRDRKKIFWIIKLDHTHRLFKIFPQYWKFTHTFSPNKLFRQNSINFPIWIPIYFLLYWSTWFLCFTSNFINNGSYLSKLKFRRETDLVWFCNL